MKKAEKQSLKVKNRIVIDVTLLVTSFITLTYNRRSWNVIEVF